MACSYGGFALRALALVGLAGLLAGCVELGEDRPSPPSSAQVSPQVPGSSAAVPLPDVPKLEPEGGETVLAQLSGATGPAGSHVNLGLGETFVSWTCEGIGPISVEFDDGVGYTTKCEDLAAMGSSRNSDMTMSGKELEVTVHAQPGQVWQLLITQKKP